MLLWFALEPRWRTGEVLVNILQPGLCLGGDVEVLIVAPIVVHAEPGDGAEDKNGNDHLGRHVEGLRQRRRWVAAARGAAEHVALDLDFVASNLSLW